MDMDINYNGQVIEKVGSAKFLGILIDSQLTWKPQAEDVRAVCCVDERRLELRVALQRAHPLRPPRLDAGAAPALPGRPAHWLALYLAAGGRLRGALRLWAGAVSARVAAAPQCYICYCRLHPASGRLPRVPCHQCKNKFHNVCLVPRPPLSRPPPHRTISKLIPIFYFPAQMVRDEQQIQLSAVQSGVLMHSAAPHPTYRCTTTCLYGPPLCIICIYSNHL
ncbi:hypothetical protein HF086_016762 [Spodoptera exigua]|uniref:E3 ubiquitin-protein ligase listerin n=1 Tax=Spodoptera exigua TaxID=7107 RepID=A0A922MLU0_SPOEX|nr:hypothetical protein HF086_016762 [Spodoptera exigua]